MTRKKRDVLERIRRRVGLSAQLRARQKKRPSAPKGLRHAHKMERRAKAQIPSDLAPTVAELLSRPEGLPLETYTHRVFSQHGEDGVTLEVLRRIGVVHQRAVEIGCGANGGNAGVLIAGLGFE